MHIEETDIYVCICNYTHYLPYVYIAALENVCQELAHSNSGNNARNVSASQHAN